MSGTSGLNTGDFTSVNVAYGIGVGVNANQGTDGQVLVSGGENQPNTWETLAGGTNERLNRGTNITMEDNTGASVDFYDGSVQTTINSTDTQFENYSAGDGIHFPSGDGTAGNPFVISTDNDDITINNGGGDNNDANQVLRVPHTLTIIDSAGTEVVYDGFVNKSITINDNDTTYQGSTTIHITGTTDPTIFQLDCLRVPMELTAGSGITFTPTGTYRGDVARTISLTAQANPNIKISSIGGSYTTGVETEIPSSSVNPDGAGGNTLGFTNIAGWGITGCEAVSTNYLIDVNFNILAVATGGSPIDASSFIRLDRDFVGTNGYSESNNQPRPTRVARTIQLATLGLANYKFYITNLVVGEEYGFVPSFYAHQSASGASAKFTIGFGGIYGQMTIVATPL